MVTIILMLYTERAETVAVSRGTSHVTTKQRCKYTTWADIQKALWKASDPFRITRDKSAVSLLENGEQRYIKATNNVNDILPPTLLEKGCRRDKLGHTL